MYRLPFGRLSMIISPSSRARAEVVLLEVGWRMAHGCCLSAAVAVAVVGRAVTTVTTQTTAAAKRERRGEERAEECGRGRQAGRRRNDLCDDAVLPTDRPTDEDGFLVPALPLALAPLVTGFEEVVP